MAGGRAAHPAGAVRVRAGADAGPEDLDEAERVFRRARELAAGLVHLGVGHALDADESGMRAALGEAAEPGGETPEIAAGIPDKARMMLAVGRGDLETACGHLDRAAAILRRERDRSFPFWGLWALLRTLAGRAGEAARRPARRLAGREIAMNRVCLRLADALAAGRSGRGVEAAELVDREDGSLTDGDNTRRHVLLAVVSEAAVQDDG